jgi:dolichol-phosphate mannosyltransferase
MDGDLQHPPEDIPRMLDRAALGDVDIVVASRYVAGGTAGGLAAPRTAVSRTSTLLTKAMFPEAPRLHRPDDRLLPRRPRHRRSRRPRPRGFKILLEILARRQMRIGEIPFAFATRFAGESKATFSQGMRFLTQLAMLRFGRMSAFALVGGVGRSRTW